MFFAKLRRGEFRLDYIYYILAAVDVVVIIVALLLSNHTMNLYQDSMERSRVWSGRIHQFADLAGVAHDVNKPGNDVFTSRNPAAERIRRDVALAEFDVRIAEVLRSFASDGDAAAARVVVPHLSAMRLYMAEMVRHGDAIFDAFEKGDRVAAGQRMAEMDTVYGGVVASTLGAVNAAQEEEDRYLEQQVALANQLRLFEFALLAMVFIIVLAVTFYGRNIGRAMQRAETTRVAMLQELQSANDRLEQYADNVAHELRGPVNKLLIGSEVTLSRQRTVDEYQEALASVVEEGQSLAQLVNALLFLARARGGSVHARRQSLDVDAEVARALAYYEALALDGDVAIRSECEPGLVFAADRDLFQRALGNLLSNALAHTPKGGRITIRGYQDGGDVVVQVEDTGRGITPDALAHVFDRFYSVPREDGDGAGAGLGLPIVRGIVELHDGVVTIESPAGRGVVATLRFPKRLETLV